MDNGLGCIKAFDKSQLCNYRSVEPGTTVTFVRGQQARALGQGEAVIQTSVNRVELLNVLHVPEATVNLFSVKKAAENGAQITFAQDKCYVYMKGSLCMEGISKNGLMIINQGEADEYYALRAAASVETAELWHRRFAHLGYDNLYKLQSMSMVDGISVQADQFKAQQKILCEPCVQAKQHRLPFPTSNRGSTKPMQFIFF